LLEFLSNALLLSFIGVFGFAFFSIVISSLFFSKTRIRYRWINNLTGFLIFEFSLMTIFLLGDVFHWWALEGILYDWLQPHLILDSSSIVYFTLTCFISILMIRFSGHYLYREKWYGKFYLNLILFVASLMIASLANQFIVFIIAWELVGITSVFLIAFYQERVSTVKNAFRTLVSYKIGDLCLYIAMTQASHYGVVSFDQLSQSSMPGWIFVLFLIAAMVKSAQYPFCYWLPRAMEGPTPTSAIFYGSMAVHLGVFLFMRISPNQLEPVNVLAAVIGAVTLLHSSFVGRAIPDIKKSYAYATMSQLAIMFIEISLGFKTLALIHLCSHSILRFYQFLQVPSVLHRRHQVESNIQHSLHSGYRGLEWLIPVKIRRFLYYFSFDEGKLHFIRKKLIVQPTRTISAGLKHLYAPLFVGVESISHKGSTFFLLFASITCLGWIASFAPVDLNKVWISLSLFMGLSLSISLFSEDELSRFFSKLIVSSGLSFYPLFLYHKNLSLFILLASYFLCLLAFYLLLRGICDFRSKTKCYIREFMGLFEQMPKGGRWAIFLLLLSSGVPLSPYFFLMEKAAEIYFEKSFLIGSLFCVSNTFLVLSLYRVTFLLLYGASNRIDSLQRKTSLYVPKQYVTRKILNPKPKMEEHKSEYC